MSYKTSYKWNKESGEAIAKIEDTDGNIFIGIAKCHPDDAAHKSEYLGTEIAEIRARMNMIRHIRDTEIKPALKALKHVQANMETNKQYNPRSYEARTVRRQIKIKEADLKAIKELIESYKDYIKNISAYKFQEAMDKSPLYF